MKVMSKKKLHTTRKHEFSKGRTWWKCPYWPKGMVILTKGSAHGRHELILTETFD
jgi:hypothetical protein